MSYNSDDDSIILLKSEGGRSIVMSEKQVRRRIESECKPKEEKKVNFEIEKNVIVNISQNIGELQRKKSDQKVNSKKYSSESSVPTIQRDLRNINDEDDFEMESINIYSDENLVIKNIDTGETFDLYREGERIDNINNEISFWKLDKGEAWGDYW